MVALTFVRGESIRLRYLITQPVLCSSLAFAPQTLVRFYR
jgi:hypothetical protein